MTNRPINHEPKDVELANEISRHLNHLGIGDFHVSVKGGHVTVSGTVEDFTDKRRVASEIHGFGGILEITNLVHVIGESITPVNSDSNI